MVDLNNYCYYWREVFKGHLSIKYVLRSTVQVLVNNQLDAQFFFLYVYFNYVHVSSTHVLIITKIYCINTMSRICHSVCWCCRYVGLEYIPGQHKDSINIQIDIYQMSYWYNWFSWWWAHGCSRHVENWNKYIRKKNRASIWLFTRIIPRCTVSKTQNSTVQNKDRMQVLNTYRGSRGIVPLVQNLGTRWKWVVNFTHQPLRSGRRGRYPLIGRGGGGGKRNRSQ